LKAGEILYITMESSREEHKREMVHITIDDRPIRAWKGSTILEAALENGIDIPHLCYQQGLSSAGACRLCGVKVTMGDRWLNKQGHAYQSMHVTACTTKVEEGMEVVAYDEDLNKARRLIIELLLAQNKHDCMVCESNGVCDLQKYAYQFGVDPKNLRFPSPEYTEPVDDSSEIIIRDLNKCILCGRCVRACYETSVQKVLHFYGRGGIDDFSPKMSLIAGFDQPLSETDCVACGACVQACPTGAITEKLAHFQGRAWEFEKIRTTCPYCGVGCQMELWIKDNKIVRVYGCEDGPDNKGALCVKGRFGLDFVDHPDRLTTPLIKQNGKFEEASWDEALHLIAGKFKKLRDTYGGDSLTGLSSAKCSNEENYLFQKFIRTCFGTNSVDHCARLCHASTVAGLAKAFGSGAMTNSVRDCIQKANVILIIGSNTTEQHPVMGYLIKHGKEYDGTKLIVADPRKIELADYADIWMQHKCGTDVALLNGLINVILNEDLYDHEFVKNRTENFEELKKVVSAYTPEKTEEITGVPKESIIAAAKLYAQADRASILYSMGITQHTTGTDNVLSVANLAMLTGNMGKEGAGVNPLRGQNNVQGACDMGALPPTLPGYQIVSVSEVREKFERAWGVKLPSNAGLTVVEMIGAASEGKVKGMYIMGENPMLSDPDIDHVEEGLKKLEFLVVQDIFLTETAQLADVVLPGCCFAEKDGTFTNTGRRVQLLHQAVNPPGESKQDWEIICELSKQMGCEMTYTSPKEIMEEIASLTPSYGGMHYERLENEGLQWPCLDSEHAGTPILHKGAFTRGKGLFTGVEYKPPVELPDKEYPFTLTTGRLLYHFHTATMTRHSKPLSAIEPEGFIEINPDDARQLGIEDKEVVEVISRRGKIQTKARFTNRVPSKTLFMPFHFAEGPANKLTNPALDPIAKIPELKVCAVAVKTL